MYLFDVIWKHQSDSIFKPTSMLLIGIVYTVVPVVWHECHFPLWYRGSNCFVWEQSPAAERGVVFRRLVV